MFYQWHKNKARISFLFILLFGNFIKGYNVLG